MTERLTVFSFKENLNFKKFGNVPKLLSVPDSVLLNISTVSMVPKMSLKALQSLNDKKEPLS